MFLSDSQEKLRVALYVQKAALQFIDGTLTHPLFYISVAFDLGWFNLLLLPRSDLEVS
jgi:hypothetical protein